MARAFLNIVFLEKFLYMLTEISKGDECMIVASIMTKNPVCITPDVSINDARALMIKEQITKLPVMNKNNELVGLITKKDLMNAGPSVATSLDMYEISYLLSKVKVDKVMNKNVTTIQENEIIEEAARIMEDNEIGCLPVMRGSMLVGIVTEKDLFKAFVVLFGARNEGVRITFTLDEQPGQIARFTTAIFGKGGNFISLVTGEFEEDSNKRICACKVNNMNLKDIEAVLKELEIGIIDIRKV